MVVTLLIGFDFKNIENFYVFVVEVKNLLVQFFGIIFFTIDEKFYFSAILLILKNLFLDPEYLLE